MDPCEALVLHRGLREICHKILPCPEVDRERQGQDCLGGPHFKYTHPKIWILGTIRNFAQGWDT